jgi:hypothetical protein
MRGLQKKSFYFILGASLAAALLLSLAMGCASNDRRPGSIGEPLVQYESNAHPASYITEWFPVNRPLPKHEEGPKVEFYFKKCNMVGDDWPRSPTSYECEYP